MHKLPDYPPIESGSADRHRDELRIKLYSQPARRAEPSADDVIASPFAN